ncbi:MAG: hypothetical protein ABJE10_14380 [bacterium]
MPTKFAAWSTIGSLLATLGAAPAVSRAPATVRLDLQTLHAAALSVARTPADSADAPYVLVSIAGPGKATTTYHMPSADHWSIRTDDAKGPLPIGTLSLQPGDSIRVLLSVLEAGEADAPEESIAGAASTVALANGARGKLKAAAIAPTLDPLTKKGAHWLGSATMLITNEKGMTYWRALDCVSTCSVTRKPDTAAKTAAGQKDASAPGASGVVELSGNSATYHLQLKVQRVS